ncbi:MAG: hypothetical protein K2K55_05660 [Duncaniella sp.]|nr:hypothetical protein [Duncaniella sp.]
MDRKYNIEFSPDFATAVPTVRLFTIEASVVNSPTSDSLWQVMEDSASGLRELLTLGEVNKRPAISATRAAYKACGKDPNRYRPSADALTRRVVKGMDLYRLETLIDIINIASLRSGYSIGCFDADKIVGETLTLGIGREGEPYEGIGRGELNISSMPVLRDEIGGIGTPTSDNERTKVDLGSRRILVVINVYGEEEDPSQTVGGIIRLLGEYAQCEDYITDLFKP